MLKIKQKSKAIEINFLDISTKTKKKKREKDSKDRDCTITNQKRINNFATYRNFAPSYLHAAVSGGWLMCKKTQTAQSLVGQNLSGTMLLKY